MFLPHCLKGVGGAPTAITGRPCSVDTPYSLPQRGDPQCRSGSGTAPVTPASSAVRTARRSGLVSAREKVRPDRSGARDLACSSPSWVRGRSVQLVCCPDLLHSVSPLRTSRRSPTAGYFFDSTACPPNWLRSAAIIFICGESSWRDANRAKSEAVIAGSGTALSMAASTVHRPSPESSA